MHFHFAASNKRACATRLYRRFLRVPAHELGLRMVSCGWKPPLYKELQLGFLSYLSEMKGLSHQEIGVTMELHMYVNEPLTCNGDTLGHFYGNEFRDNNANALLCWQLNFKAALLGQFASPPCTRGEVKRC